MRFKDFLKEQDDDLEKLHAWMDDVKKAYADKAKKIKFLGRVEDGKHLFFAEIPNEDRCYGVFDMEKNKGEVLGESSR